MNSARPDFSLSRIPSLEGEPRITQISRMEDHLLALRHQNIRVIRVIRGFPFLADPHPDLETVLAVGTGFGTQDLALFLRTLFGMMQAP